MQEGKKVFVKKALLSTHQMLGMMRDTRGLSLVGKKDK